MLGAIFAVLMVGTLAGSIEPDRGDGCHRTSCYQRYDRDDHGGYEVYSGCCGYRGWYPRMDSDPVHRWLRGCVRLHGANNPSITRALQRRQIASPSCKSALPLARAIGFKTPHRTRAIFFRQSGMGADSAKSEVG
jgi:hypothetical protein